MGSKPRALIIEDDASTLGQMTALVEGEGFDVSVASTFADAQEALETQAPDVVLSDLVLPDGSGLDLLPSTDGSTDVVFITGQATVETVITALRQGALDYLTKPVDVKRLRQILAEVANASGDREARHLSIEQARSTGTFGRLIGRSPRMLHVYRQIQKVAVTGATVLLQGETGTGKELVARTIHDMSSRANEPFVPLNCGAVSSTLIESELFGHEKGSFTGANKRHIGVFERAHEGSLFLDEITEMPMELQVKLLRVLETRSFSRVGGEKLIRSEARLIAATNRAPEEAVRLGKLREDLFYRLRVFPIHLPPLHAREGDVDLLVDHFLDAHNREANTAKKITPPAMQWLREQEWPGNVRELQNLIHRAFILADDTIDLDSLQVGDEESTTEVSSRGEIRVRVGSSIAEAEKALIVATLERFGGDKKKAARVLGISVKTLYSRLNVYDAAKRASIAS